MCKKNHLKISLNANLAFEDNRFGNNVGGALRYDPTQPVYDSSSPFGGFYQHRNGSIVSNGTTNPLAALLQTNNTGDSNRAYGNLNFDYKFHFLPELRAVLNIGYDETEATTINISSSLVPTNDDVKGNSSRGFQKRTNKLLDGYLTYNKEFDKFRTEFTAGYSYQKFTNNGNNTGNQRDPLSFPSTFAEPDVVLIGFFGRANVSFLDKYLLTLTYRRDGTSRFSKENQWGDFPAAALAWNISDEDFLKDSNLISNLKLRASYGITGQQAFFGANDIYLNRYRAGNENSQYQFGNTAIQSLIASEINPDIKWEETATIEFGIDYGLFDERLSGSLNFFQKNSTDLLFTASVADGTNFSNSIIQNIGELQIQGIEFALNADVVKQDDFAVDFNFNATFLDREIKELALGQDVRTGGISGGTGNNIQILREGFAPNSFSVFKQLYDNSGNPIEGAFVDLNGDNIINDDDRYLKENDQNDVGGLILAGGWIESIYFASNAVEMTGNIDIKQRIAEQKTTVYNLMQLLMPYYSNPEFALLIDELNELNDLYEQVESTYTFIKPTVDIDNKTTTINSTTTVDISDDQLKAISDKILKMRLDIIS